jgi:hypothetical protein
VQEKDNYLALRDKLLQKGHTSPDRKLAADGQSGMIILIPNCSVERMAWSVLAGRFPLIRPAATFSPTGEEGRDEGTLAVSPAFKPQFSTKQFRT